jgi:hypothetical protein
MTAPVNMLLALLGAAAFCPGAEPSHDLRVTNDGTVRVSPMHGETTWTGTMTIEHARFRMTVQGRAWSFNGPAIRRTTPAPARLAATQLSLEHEWISLVALGDIRIVPRTAIGEAPPIVASKVVYIPGSDRLMIDGVCLADPRSGAP